MKILSSKEIMDRCKNFRQYNLYCKNPDGDINQEWRLVSSVYEPELHSFSDIMSEIKDMKLGDSIIPTTEPNSKLVLIKDDKPLITLPPPVEHINTSPNNRIDGERFRRLINRRFSSFGYNLRLSNKFELPAKFLIDADEEEFLNSLKPELIEANYYDLKPHESINVFTEETLTIPANIFGNLVNIPSVINYGIMVIPYGLEPGTSGVLTLTIINCSKNTVRLKCSDDIVEVVFYEIENVE